MGIVPGIPVVASNMDTVGTFEMARSLGGLKLFTCVHKHYTVDEWTRFRTQCLGTPADQVVLHIFSHLTTTTDPSAHGYFDRLE
jgi:hypothetical protein